MSGPWEDYAHLDGPWHDYATPSAKPHQAEAEKAVAKTAEMGIPFLNNMAHRVTQGMTLGWGDELMAGLRAIAPGTTYAKEKAIQNAIEERAKKETGKLGTAAEVLGGLGTGLGASRAGLTAIREGQSLIPRILGSSAEGGVYGGITGAGNEDGNRLGGAVKGAATGAAVGAGLPAAGAALGGAGAVTVSNILSRIDPNGAARAQVGKAFMRSGMTPDEIAAAVRQGQREGNTGFTYADASQSTQDMLEGLMQSPGAGRAAAVPWLYGRQAEHGRRMTSFVEDALLRSPQAKKTAMQYATDKTQARDTLADVLWPQAREGAGAVDVTGAVSKADELLAPGLSKWSPESKLPDDTIESVVRKARGLLANDSEQLTNFSSVAQAKRDIKALHDNNRSARYITGPMLKELDTALEASSDKYRLANDIFARQSKAIEAVDLGKQMARSGRPEDTIPAYNAMRPAEQRAARVGYADQTVTPFYNSKTRNYASDVTGPGVAAEIEAMAGAERAALLQRQALRENQMRSTLDKSVGNSATARRLANQEDTNIDPRVFGALSNIAQGNYGTAVKDFGHAFGNRFTGTTEAVRNEAIRLLLGNQVKNIPVNDPGLFLRALRKVGYPKSNRPASDVAGIISDSVKQAKAIEKAKVRATRAGVYGSVGLLNE